MRVASHHPRPVSAIARQNGSDCIVIGAGLIGLSTALHLAWRGRSVRVLERGRIGDGTSSKASGWISAQLRTPNSLLELVLRSLDQYPAFLERLDDACGYERCGSLVVMDSADGLEQRKLLDATQREVSAYAGARFLDGRDAHELEPALSDSIIAAAYFTDDAQVEAQSLLAAMLRACAKARVAVHQGADARAISREEGAWRVTTPIGTYDADAIVVASGAWSPSIAELAGFELPVLPVSGQLLVSTPRPALLKRCVVYQPDARFATRLACGIRPALDGRLWMGTTYRAGSFDVAITPEDTAAILGAVGSVFPSLRDVAVEEAWAGVRPVPEDLVPIYGRVAGQEGMFAAVPVAGLAECAAAGALMADLVDGAPAGTDAAQYSPDRFGTAD